MTLSELRRRERELARDIGAVRKKIKAARPKTPRPKAPGATKAERRKEYRERTAFIREAVFARSGGKCELCGTELGAAWDMHHTLGGGLRRVRQAISNCVATCFDCHRAIHRNDLVALDRIARLPFLDAEARQSALRRLSRVSRVPRGSR